MRRKDLREGEYEKQAVHRRRIEKKSDKGSSSKLVVVITAMKSGKGLLTRKGWDRIDDNGGADRNQSH